MKKDEVIIEGPGTTIVTASLVANFAVAEEDEEEDELCRCGVKNCVRRKNRARGKA